MDFIHIAKKYTFEFQIGGNYFDCYQVAMTTNIVFEFRWESEISIGRNHPMLIYSRNHLTFIKYILFLSTFDPKHFESTQHVQRLIIYWTSIREIIKKMAN